ncbi:MAG: hypothetical protein IPG16_00910 [Comamonadaceae bacterium]|nr:hypothetical protein [Comamonadaceae bacterium]
MVPCAHCVGMPGQLASQRAARLASVTCAASAPAPWDSLIWPARGDRAAGQAQVQPGVAAAALEVEGQAALQLGVIGLQQQGGQGEGAALPAALGTQGLQALADRRGAGRAAWERRPGQVRVEGPGLPGDAGRQLAVQRSGSQPRVGGGRIHALQRGTGVPGERRGLGAFRRIRRGGHGLRLGQDASTGGHGVKRFDDPLAARIAGAGFQLVQRQLLAVPGAGQGVRQVGLRQPAVGPRHDRGLASQQGAGRLRPQGRQVEPLPVALGAGNGLRLPGLDAGRHRGLHRRAGKCAAWGGRASGDRRGQVPRRQPGGQLQGGIHPGQRTLRLCAGHQRDRSQAARWGGHDLALKVHGQGHGARSFKLTRKIVVSRRNTRFSSVDPMNFAIKSVSTRQAIYDQRRRADPFQRGHFKGSLDPDRQRQLGGRGRRCRRPLVFDPQAGDGEPVQPQLAIEQAGQRPGHFGITGLHAERTLAPAQPADAPA